MKGARIEPGAIWVSILRKHVKCTAWDERWTGVVWASQADPSGPPSFSCHGHAVTSAVDDQVISDMAEMPRPLVSSRYRAFFHVMRTSQDVTQSRLRDMPLFPNKQLIAAAFRRSF